ncbi:MAG: hypothetical protein MR771_06390 [Treponema succinifaciens]|uniref:hypothetical protein n=1 Tax=Treponema succinifaciens TaxID=167 RepID=UPI002356E931|nr:hypothetical protein [Treponema succinifaciens]MCI6912777.1 hypothetical protein [Treponema succinifaciens]
MRKFGFTALVSFLFLLASCMNMGGSSGEDGAIRVALPGSGSRGAYTLSKEKAKTYKVALLLDGENLKTQTSETGGADIVFDELEPATYTVQVEAYDTNDVLLARKSETIKVTAGETAECSIALKLFASSILESNYILWNYSNNIFSFNKIANIKDSTINTNFTSLSLNFAEDISDNMYYIDSNMNLQRIFVDDVNWTTIPAVTGSLFSDPLYYDDSTDSLWIARDGDGNVNTLQFSVIKNISTGTNPSIDFKSGLDSFEYYGAAFAIQGSVLYLAYIDSDGSTYYLQRATITENADGTFAVSKVGSAKSVSDLGVSGAITDVAILYDGTVYVLVSNVGNSSGDSGDSFKYYYDQSNTMYSRGALLKIRGTSSGFEVVDTLGWTGSSRQIAPVGEAVVGGKGLKSLTAYIPSFSEKSNKFYGPRRFVAIKPKEIAIADCGANFVMPNCKEGQKGNMFAHNRVVTVSLSSFAISGATELRNIKFSDLTLSGSGTSGAWILADGCDNLQNEQ